jgi:poly(A) polymerase
LTPQLPADPLAVGEWLDALEAIGELPPELVACQETAQPAGHHSEGDVYRHTRLAIGSLTTAAKWVGVEPSLDQAAAVLCHDIGKPACWDPEVGHFYRHEVVGAELAPPLLDRIDEQGRVDREQVAWCVRHHLFWLHADIAVVRDARVAQRYCREDGWSDTLRVLNICDGLASWGPEGRPNIAFLTAVQEKIDEVRYRRAGVSQAPAAVLDGHDVMSVLGIPAGPEVGEWLSRLAATGIKDPEEACRWLEGARDA